MSLAIATIAQLEDEGAIIAIQDGNHGEKHPKANDYVDAGIPFIMASDLRDGYVDVLGSNKLPQSITDRLRIGFTQGGDILLSHKGSVGYVAVAPDYDPYLMLTPQVWERRSLAEVSEIVMGQSPKSTFYNNDGDGLPFHQGVSNFGFRFVTHKTYSTKITKRAQAGDILLSVRAPVGRINLTKDMIVLGRGLAAIRSKINVQSFLFYALKNHFYAEDIIGTGAIYAATNKRELESQSFVTPTSRLLLEFNEQAAAIDQQIENLTEQNQKLAQARDLLLPRLMNGELAV